MLYCLYCILIKVIFKIDIRIITITPKNLQNTYMKRLDLHTFFHANVCFINVVLFILYYKKHIEKSILKIDITTILFIMLGNYNNTQKFENI